MKYWLAFVCVGGVVVCAETEVFAANETREVKKEDGAEAQKDVEAQDEAARDAQVFRVNAGASMATLNAGSSGLAGVGSLGAVGPTVSINAGPRLAGPLWLAVGLEGSVNQSEPGEQAESMTAWGVGGSIALRLDVPILPMVELGGSVTPRINAQFGQWWNQLSVSGHLGVGLHLRPTNFFGIRTEVELFRVGYTRFEPTGSDVYELFAAEIYAGPSASLTFSF